MNAEDLAFAPLTQVASLIRTRVVSPVEVVQTYLDRIDRWDAQLHAYITVCRESALQEARQAEAAVMRGDDLGALHGVPIGVKDQFLTSGIRTTGGMRALAENVPNETATAVARLHDAGAILLGKLNMTEAALGGTVNFPFGQPRNPWNQEYDAGSSSTGSGIAAAAALCSAALGEDTGGSIRNPACFNGVVGLRPSWERVSRHGIMPLVWDLDTAGPLARTVRDCAALLQVIAGHDSKDPFSARLPVPDYEAPLDGELRGLRIGVIREMVDSKFINREVQDAVKAAALQFGRLGATVEDVSLPLVLLAGVVFLAICDSSGGLQHRRILATRPGEFDQAPRRRMLAASLIPANVYHKVQQARNLIRNQVRAAFERFDILLCPTAPTAAALIAAARNIVQSKDDLVRLFERRSYTSPFPLAGTPALSMPCGFTQSGLPIGLQLAAASFKETTLLRVAHAYERSTTWHTQRPPLH